MVTPQPSQQDQALEYARSRLRSVPVIGRMANRITSQGVNNMAKEANERAAYERNRREAGQREQKGAFSPEPQAAIGKGDVTVPHGLAGVIGGNFTNDTYEQMGRMVGGYISGLLKKGSPIGKMLALFVAMVSDMVDPVTTILGTLGSETIIIPILTTLLSGGVGVLSLATLFILKQEFGIFGHTFRKRLVKRFIAVSTIEIFPGVELLPINTVLMIWLLKKIKKRRNEFKQHLSALSRSEMNPKTVMQVMESLKKGE